MTRPALIVALLLTGCMTPNEPAAPPAELVRVTYACESGPPLTVAFDNVARTVTIESEIGPIRLPQAPSASGFLYETPRHRLQGKGDEVIYTIGRAVPRKCSSRSGAESSEWASIDARYDSLRAAGVDWIAIGQEPGWTAEVRDGERIDVVADYGKRKAIVPAPKAGTAGANTEYHSVTEANDVRLTLTRGACADAMSGRPYPARAVLVLNGRRYEGCAQPLN